jgi:Fe-S cluster assembly protein SufD
MNLPEFKHGLNILLEPKFNFENICPDAESSNTLVVHSSNPNISVSRSLNFQTSEFALPIWEDPSSKNKVWHNHNLFVKDIALIKIPSYTESEIDIRIDIKDENSLLSIFIVSEKNSKAKITLYVKSQINSRYISEMIKVMSRENSIIDINSIHELSSKVTFFQDRRAVSYADSRVDFSDLFVGSEYSRSETKVILNGARSKSDNLLIYLSKNNEIQDFYTSILHNSKNTESHIVVRGVLKDHSRALSRGLIKISPNAQFSKGYEKQEALILDSGAEADAMPNLEIENNDVQCSHGSTIGKIDEEEIFYLMSRGLTKHQALNMIVQGYFLPVLDKFSNSTIKSKIMEVINRNINGD